MANVSNWKGRERAVAAALGGQRNVERTGNFGITGRDVVGVPGYCVEVKTRANLPKLMVDSLEQSEGYSKDEIAIAVLCQKRKPIGRAITVMRFEDFVELKERIEQLEEIVKKK